tara:strand:+ start:9602 stop:9775 length:174 start_codon:yes stop_codon:yes gene_type:complete
MPRLDIIPEGIPFEIIRGISILKVDEIIIDIEKTNKNTLLYAIIHSPKKKKRKINNN